MAKSQLISKDIFAEKKHPEGECEAHFDPKRAGRACGGRIEGKMIQIWFLSASRKSSELICPPNLVD